MEKLKKLQAEDLKILKRIDTFASKHDIKYILFSGTLLGAVRHRGFIPWDDDLDIAMRRTEYNKFDDLLVAGNFDGEEYYYQSNRLEKFYWSEVSKVRTNTVNVTERVPTTQKGFFGPWVDIFPYDNVPDDEDLRMKQYKKITRLGKVIKFFLLTIEEPEDKGIIRFYKKTIRKINEKLYKTYFFLPWLFSMRYKEITKYNSIKTQASGCLAYLGYIDYQEYEGFFIDNQDFEDLIRLPFEDGEFLAPKNYDKILKNAFGDYMKVPGKEYRASHKIDFY